MTVIEKNLIIAALECSLANGKAAAGITTLTDIETTLAALRTAYTTDPATVLEKDLWTFYAKFQRLQFPNVENLWWAILDAPVFDVDIELRTTWGDITNKPAKFPPADHSHPAQTVTWEDVQSKPTTFPPSDHAHVKADVTDFPTAFPPAAHSHVKADVTDFPTAFPPELHTHVKADVTDFPTTMPPSAHSHAYADITSKPTTFAPSAHSHAVTAYAQYLGNGAASRTLTLSASIMPTLIFILKGSEMFYWYWITPFGVDIRTANSAVKNAISVTTGTITLNVANISGELFTIMAWGNAS